MANFYSFYYQIITLNIYIELFFEVTKINRNKYTAILNNYPFQLYLPQNYRRQNYVLRAYDTHKSSDKFLYLRYGIVQLAIGNFLVLLSQNDKMLIQWKQNITHSVNSWASSFTWATRQNSNSLTLFQSAFINFVILLTRTRVLASYTPVKLMFQKICGKCYHDLLIIQNITIKT